MAWNCGIVGLPNAGKSSLFKALTALEVTIEPYPFSTIEPNIASIPLADTRLTALAGLSAAEKITPASIEVVDVAGLVKGAAAGEGLGNQFLGHLRNCDLLIHVVPAYENQDPKSLKLKEKIEIVNYELCLADLETIARRRNKIKPQVRCNAQAARFEDDLLEKLEYKLNEGILIRENIKQDPGPGILQDLPLLTSKPMLYVINVNENALVDSDLTPYFPGTSIPLSARLEAELAELPPEEKKAYLEAFGYAESKTTALMLACYHTLDLLTFYTIKGTEARAWIIPVGTSAVEAAARVHTDMVRGFIKAEVVPAELLLSAGSLNDAREKGYCRTEGREYRVMDGDVIYFKFRV